MTARLRGATSASAVHPERTKKLWGDSHSRELLPWFYIRGWTTGTRSLSALTINDAIDIPEVAKSVQIVNISIVTPSWMNQSGSWQLDTVTEMWIAPEPDPIRGNTIAMFVTEQGNRYIVGVIDPTEDELNGLQRVDFR